MQRRAKCGCWSSTVCQGATAQRSHVHRPRAKAICEDTQNIHGQSSPFYQHTHADMHQHLVVCTSRVTGIVGLVFNKEADYKYPTHGMTEGSELTLLDSWLVSHQPLVVVGSPHDWVHLFKNSSEHNDKDEARYECDVCKSARVELVAWACGGPAHLSAPKHAALDSWCNHTKRREETKWLHIARITTITRENDAPPCCYRLFHRYLLLVEFLAKDSYIREDPS